MWPGATLNTNYASPPNTLQDSISSDTPTPGSPPTTIDLQVDEAHELKKAGKFAEAEVILTNLQRYGFARITQREKFRVIANLGHLHSAKGDFQEAAAKYVEAYQYQCTSLKARELLPLAIWYRGDATQAFRKAQKLLQEHPENVLSHAVCIFSAPTTNTVSDLESVIPESLSERVEILDALYQRAMTEDNPREAESYARRLLAVRPDDSRTKVLLGTAILVHIGKAKLQALSISLTPEEESRFLECETLFTDAVSELRESGSKALLSAALRNLASAVRAQGDATRCRALIAEAYSLTPDDPEILGPHVFELIHNGQADKARSLISAHLASAPNPNIRMLFAMLLRDSDDPRDHELAIGQLLDNFDETQSFDQQYRIEWMFLAIHLIGRTKAKSHKENVERLISTSSFSAVEIRILRARLEHATNDAAAAEQLLTDTFQDCDDQTSAHELRIVANALFDAKHYTEAFSLYEKFVPKDTLTADTHSLLQAGQFAGEDRKVLDLCKGLRESSVADAQVYSLEMALLIDYNERDALAELLKEGQQRFPSAIEFSINLWLLGLRWDSPEWKCPSADVVPPVGSVTSELGFSVVQVLVGTFGRSTAATYAYQLWRRFPNEPSAAKALVYAILFPQTPDPSLDIPTTVVEGSAVAFTPADSDELYTYVIEPVDDPHVDMSRMELPADHVLAQILLGLGVDDQFTEPATFGEGRTCTIRTITRADVFRANQLAHKWHQTFPDVPFIQAFGGSSELDAEPSLRSVIGEQAFALLRTQGRQIEKLFQIYKEDVVPLCMVAKSLGHSVISTMSMAVSESRGGVHCALGNHTERRDALRAIAQDAPNGVVLDTTALGTLFFLGSADLLAALQCPLFVTVGAVESLRELLLSIPSSGEPTLSIIPSAEQPEVHSRSVAEQDDMRIRLQALMTALNTYATTVGGSSLAAMSHSDRKSLREWYTIDIAEAIAVALEKKCLLWTDDVRTAQLVSERWSIRSVWTMAVAWHLGDSGRVAARSVNTIGIKLNLWYYRFVGIWPSMVVQCLQDADWNPNGPAPKRILTLFVDSLSNNVLRNTQLLASVLREAWRLAEKLPAETVTRALLSELGGTPHAEKTVRFLLGVTDPLFGLDVVGAAHLKRILQDWIEESDGSSGSLIVSP